MNHPGVLLSKINPPPLRASRVPRRRLHAVLDRVLERPLGVVIGPAGFGKTTLIRSWLEHSRVPAAWVSLDDRDGTPARFWTYFIRAVQQVNPAFGGDILELLAGPGGLRMEELITRLSNAWGPETSTLVVVLDDLHSIHSPEIHEQLNYLIDYLPPPVHLLAASRSVPSLRLAHRRARAQLVELGPSELRFTAAEVDHVLQGIMNVELCPAERIQLDLQTEGWIAGLQLAALSLQRVPDKSSFLASFSGEERQIRDYLFEEVFQRQPEGVQQFLLETSLPKRLCGSLCDALTGRSGGQQMLELLERENLFLAPLDTESKWYGYHPLFAGLLQSQQARSHPDQISIQHQRTAHWFAGQGMLADAISHGLAAGDFEQAAAWIETYMAGDWISADMHDLLGWVAALPGSVLQSRPRLALSYCWLLLELYTNRWNEIEIQLKNVEKLLMAPGSDAISREEAGRMQAEVVLLRANHARNLGDHQAVVDLCRAALDRLPEEEVFVYSGLTGHLAAGYAALGEVNEASRWFARSLELCRAADNLDGLIFAGAGAIEAQALAGDLHGAVQLFYDLEPALAGRTGPDTGLLYINLGEVYREQNKFEEAAALLEEGLRRCRPFEAWSAAVVSGCLSLARLETVREDLPAADAFLHEARLRQPALPASAAGERAGACGGRLALIQGRFEKAAAWARREAPALDQRPTYAAEAELLVLVRVLLAQSRLAHLSAETGPVSQQPLLDARLLLQGVREQAHQGGRFGVVIEADMLLALLHDFQGESEPAETAIEKALAKGQAAGYRRLFLDEGEPLRQLLAKVVSRPTKTAQQGYAEILLAAFPETAAVPGDAKRHPADRLTRREQDALRLLATTLSMEEIAAEMTVAVSTVRTYAKRIYGKLDAHSRAEAVYRAKTIGLL